VDEYKLNRMLGHIYSSDEGATFALLDGASIPTLLDKLYDGAAPEFACLFAGELEPDMAEVAPYIARLEQESKFADWVMSGWGDHWGIFALVPADIDLATVRRHLRKLNMVYGPNNQPLYFRWYDPRVMRIVLPTCDSAQLKEMFGPVLRFITEGETPDHGFVFSLANGELVQERFSVKM
jgi:hypothetical protein